MPDMLAASPASSTDEWELYGRKCKAAWASLSISAERKKNVMKKYDMIKHDPVRVLFFFKP